MRNFFSKFFCLYLIDLEISLFCKQTGPKYVNKWLKQISLPFLYSPWIVETPELCHKKWPDFYLKLSRSISVKLADLFSSKLMDPIIRRKKYITFGKNWKYLQWLPCRSGYSGLLKQSDMSKGREVWCFSEMYWRQAGQS